MISRLDITRTDLNRIEQLARQAFPHEACGLLVGTAGGDAALQVTRVIESANLAGAGTQDRFEIDPKLQFALLRELRGTPEAIIGVFHSHPNGRSEPSPRDLEDANDPSLIWLVTGITADGTATSRAFTLSPAADHFEEILIGPTNPA